MGAKTMNEHATSTWPTLDEAHEALRKTLSGLHPSDWSRPTPCAQWNVAQVLQHAAGDQLGYAASITGNGWPTFDPFAPTGTLTHTHDADADADADAAHDAAAPSDESRGGLAAFAESTLRTSAEAWSTIPQDATEVPTPLPQ